MKGLDRASHKIMTPSFGLFLFLFLHCNKSLELKKVFSSFEILKSSRALIAQHSDLRPGQCDKIGRFIGLWATF